MVKVRAGADRPDPEEEPHRDLGCVVPGPVWREPRGSEEEEALEVKVVGTPWAAIIRARADIVTSLWTVGEEE